MSGSPYILNIVELQNVQTSATGLTDAQQFSDMIDTLNRTVRLNVLRSYDTGATTLTMNDTTVTLSNAVGSEVDLRVYGNIYASNYYSLCPLRFWVGAERPYEAMHVTEEGRIGVGTSTPAALMDIRGDMRTGGNVWCGGDVIIEGNVVIRGSLRVEGSNYGM